MKGNLAIFTLWNWRLSEDGWMFIISTPTIAITAAVFVVASSAYSLRNIRSIYNKFVDHRGCRRRAGGGRVSGPINEAKKRNIIKKRLDKRIFILYKHIR